MMMMLNVDDDDDDVDDDDYYDDDHHNHVHDEGYLDVSLSPLLLLLQLLLRSLLPFRREWFTVWRMMMRRSRSRSRIMRMIVMVMVLIVVKFQSNRCDICARFCHSAESGSLSVK